MRSHRELLLNYFRARKEFSSGVIEGLNNKAKVTMRRSYGFRTVSWNSRSIIRLANYPSRHLPTNSSDEPKNISARGRFRIEERPAMTLPAREW